MLLGRMRLGPGPHTIRFTLAGAGRGGGSAISLDELSLIEAPAPADVREEVTVDNGEQSYQVVSGTWSSGTGVTGYYGSNYASHAAGAGTSAMRWRPALAGDDRYEVLVSYSAASNRASKRDVHGEPRRRQHAGRCQPAGTRGTGTTGRGVGVARRLPFRGGIDGNVVLTDAADGVVIADAVRFRRQVSP